tara:strand:- start:1081 stop:1938 length:858 start_codon:yes stop_codon:yes gene_type:complete
VGNLKEIRTRISSISKSMQITSAMKMVSAARLKKSQQRIEKMRPYAEKMGDLISDLSVNSENKNGLIEEREQKKILFLFLSSNKGLCGSFNTSLVKHLEELCKKHFSQTKNEVFCLGKKAGPILKRKGFSIVSVNTDIIENPNFKETGIVSGKIMADFLAQKYDKVILLYNKFKNAAVQIPTHEQLLPIQKIGNSEKGNNSYEFEPSSEEILEQLLPNSIKIKIFKSLLESIASENGSRMTAMHKATDNAKELQEGLKLSYNRQRQAAITGEILEIVAGAEALQK